MIFIQTYKSPNVFGIGDNVRYKNKSYQVLINFTKEELYKIEECINGDGDSYGDSICESILDKIENCPDLYKIVEEAN